MHVTSYVDITTVIKQVGFTMKNRNYSIILNIVSTFRSCCAIDGTN